MKNTASWLILSVLVFSLVGSGFAAPPLRPFPQHLTYTAGTIRPNHRTQAQQDDDVRAFYDRWKSRYLAQAGTEADGHPRYRVKFSRDSNAKTVSEGQGYGMIIVALMAGYDANAQTIFDGLWEYAKDHRSAIDPRLMDWSVPASEMPDPTGDGDGSAFDGDCDIAFALLLAEKQWGNVGRFNYHTEAAEVMAGILESTIGPESHLPMLGDWVTSQGVQYNQYTPRPSDFMPDHFRSFGQATGLSVWFQVVDTIQAVATSVQANYSPATGLLPDFLEPISASNHALRPASPSFLEGPNDGFYYYNAVRVPWRLGTDALLSDDPVSRRQTQKIARWARSAADDNPASLRAGYRLDGAVLPEANYFSTLYAATFAVAAMTEPTQQPWLNALYDAVRLSDENYYEDTVTLLCLLAMTGNSWTPSELRTSARNSWIYY